MINNPSNESRQVLDYLGLKQGDVDPFKTLGHWHASGVAFTYFMWKLARDIGKPVVVLHDPNGAGYANPLCTYAPGTHLPRMMTTGNNAGAFAHLKYADMLSWIDEAEGHEPPFALVDLRPGHYSAFIFSGRSNGGRSAGGHTNGQHTTGGCNSRPSTLSPMRRSASMCTTIASTSTASALSLYSRSALTLSPCAQPSHSTLPLACAKWHHLSHASHSALACISHQAWRWWV